MLPTCFPSTPHPHSPTHIYMQWTSPDKRKNIKKIIGKETVARVTLWHCSILISANFPSNGWLDAMVYTITGTVLKLCSPQAVNHKKGRYIIHYRISAHIVQIHCCSGRQSLISGFQLLSVPFVGDIMAPNIYKYNLQCIFPCWIATDLPEHFWTGDHVPSALHEVNTEPVCL